MNVPVGSSVRSIARKPLVVVAVLAVLGAALSAYMWYESIRLHAEGYKVGVMLCPETALINCKEVLLSRYAQWLGLPVAAAGVANYAVLLVVTAGLLAVARSGPRRLLWTAGVTLAALGSAAGLWLLYVQILRLHTICYICDIVHLCGLVSLILLIRIRPAGQTGRGAYVGAAAVALASLAGLVLGQELFKPEIEPQMLVVATQPAAATMSSGVNRSPATQTQPTDTQLALAARIQPAASQPANAFIVRDSQGTQIAVLDLDQEVVLGDPAAERTVIELMDFGCHECRHELELFQEIWKTHPRWFRVICLMFPNNTECNRFGGGNRPHVCEIARAALAVRKHVPDKYRTTHETLYRMQNTLTGGLAWQVARELCQVEDSTLDAWQDDPALLERIKQHVELGSQLQGSIAKPGLPTLYADGMVFCGSDETVKDLEAKLTKLIGPPDGPPRVPGNSYSSR